MSARAASRSVCCPRRRVGASPRTARAGRRCSDGRRATGAPGGDRGDRRARAAGSPLLSAAGIAVAVVNPRHSGQFAKGLGLARQDRSPRRAMLARYGELARPAARPPLERAAGPPASPGAAPPPARSAAQWRGQPAAPCERAADPGPPSAHLEWLKAELATLDEQIADALAARPEAASGPAFRRRRRAIGPVATSAPSGAAARARPPSTARRSPRSPAWGRSRQDSASAAASARSDGGRAGCAACSTWRRWWRAATTR